MKKTSRLVLTLILVVMMVFGVVAPVVGYAAQNTPASQSANSSSDRSYDAGWIEINRIGNELIVTISPDIDSAKQIDKSMIKEIAYELFDHAKVLVLEALREDIKNSQYGEGNEGFTNLESVWSTALDAHLGINGYDNYNDFFEAAAEDAALIDGLVDYADSLLVAAHKMVSLIT